MGCEKGFQLVIGRHTYRVVCEIACCHTTLAFVGNHQYHTNGAITLRVFMDNKETDIETIDPYAVEQIFYFIENSINGQDACYWNDRGTNRHHDKTYKEEELV